MGEQRAWIVFVTGFDGMFATVLRLVRSGSGGGGFRIGVRSFPAVFIPSIDRDAGGGNTVLTLRVIGELF